MDYHNNNSVIVFGINGTSADRYEVAMGNMKLPHMLPWMTADVPEIGFLSPNARVVIITPETENAWHCA
eukprot:gene34609-41908_t